MLSSAHLLALPTFRAATHVCIFPASAKFVATQSRREPATVLNSNPKISCRADAAACAPTQLATVETLPLSYPYHYLRNTRNNHMPLTFWGYSQLYDPPKSMDAVASERNRVGTGWDYDPQQNELVAQVSSTDCDECLSAYYVCGARVISAIYIEVNS